MKYGEIKGCKVVLLSSWFRISWSENSVVLDIFRIGSEISAKNKGGGLQVKTKSSIISAKTREEDYKSKNGNMENKLKYTTDCGEELHQGTYS